MPDIVVRPLEPADIPTCERILRGLPDWFGFEETNRRYIRDLSVLPAFVACVGNDLLGFLAVRHHNPYTSEIRGHEHLSRKLRVTIALRCRKIAPMEREIRYCTSADGTRIAYSSPTPRPRGRWPGGLRIDATRHSEILSMIPKSVRSFSDTIVLKG